MCNNKKTLKSLYEISKGEETFDFKDVISSYSEKRMLKLKNSLTLSRIEMWAKEFMIEYNKSPKALLENYELKGKKVPGRINEFGNLIEREFFDFLVEKGQEKHNLNSENGYPDGLFKFGEDLVYLEIKTFSTKNTQTSQRSFYFSFGKNCKIKNDASHILVGFEKSTSTVEFVTKDKRKIKVPEEFIEVKTKDLRDLKVKLKIEFNASNKEIY